MVHPCDIRGFRAMTERIDRNLLIELGVGLTTPHCVTHGHGTNGHEDGYLLVTYDGVRMTLSRAICFELHGPPPTPKHQAAHSCGFTQCITGGHLRWATPRQNQADRKLHGTANVSRKPVLPRIRALFITLEALGCFSQDRLAEVAKVSPRTIRNWKQTA